MKYKAFKTLVVVGFVLLLPKRAEAFLPPDLIVQGISSIWAVVFAVVAVVTGPLIALVKYIKSKINKKKIFLVVALNILVALALGLAFYYLIYRPLYQKSDIFSNDNELYSRELEPNDPRNFNKDYLMVNNLIRDNKENIVDTTYGIYAQDVENSPRKVYFIDIREAEEFQTGHVKGAKNKRHADINSLGDIIEILDISLDELNRSLIVFYCHNGDRGYYAAKLLDNNNIKYLIGGLDGLAERGVDYFEGSYYADEELFGEDYQYKYQVRAESAKELLSGKEVMVLDFRLGSKYADSHLTDSLHLLFNTMKGDEYERRLAKVLASRDKEIVIIADRYAELFYANLMIYRLTNNYGFLSQQFKIIFNQFDELRSLDGLIFESGYPEVI